MPAIMTHYFYGEDTYFTTANTLRSHTGEEKQAYLLGCQGPDPFESLQLAPRLHEYKRLGLKLQTDQIEECLANFKGSLAYLSDHERPTGRAYVAGYIAHFELDSRVDPFIGAWQQQLCDAGIEGLDERDARVVKAEVERDLDEMVLYTKTGKTVDSFHPVQCLEASDRIFSIVNRMYRYMLLKTYNEVTPHNLFSGAINAHRTMMRMMRSPHVTDLQSELASAFEINILHRRHSLYRAMAHRARKEATSEFDNSKHEVWINPYTGSIDEASFWDLFYETQGEVQTDLNCFLSQDFNAEKAKLITHGLDFDGTPTQESKKDEDTEAEPEKVAAE